MFNPISFAPLTADHHDAVRAMSVKPFQVVFSGQPAEALDQPEPGTDLHVILRNDAVVGMFRVDLNYHHAHTFAPADAVGIRTFIIDQNRQGAGFGTAACRALPAYLRTHYPLKSAAYLTVNLRNAGAVKAYVKGGWTDTGAQHLLGAAGPQHIMRMALTG